MNHRKSTALKLVATAWLATFTGAAAGEGVEFGRGAGVPATGWYPADVIDRRGMDRYTEAWYLEPCMNGSPARPPAPPVPAGPPSELDPEDGIPLSARPAGAGRRP